ncbi:unnamed protein product [Vitrella brassicaformis CCMP3155]|uniref:Uncharacterized protein n=3 Tax=Vitrella brassicaformis TaxID=1169539 RepID=A0A0G4GWB0_VITBC|nr:unnamed protein product [Vitrella brassicaformis CCMP3155]|eukprot:CEM35251.1 unnamed protein product [Vitrella brassicaformis CCMP3155]
MASPPSHLCVWIFPLCVVWLLLLATHLSAFAPPSAAQTRQPLLHRRTHLQEPLRHGHGHPAADFNGPSGGRRHVHVETALSASASGAAAAEEAGDAERRGEVDRLLNVLEDGALFKNVSAPLIFDALSQVERQTSVGEAFVSDRASEVSGGPLGHQGGQAIDDQTFSVIYTNTTWLPFMRGYLSVPATARLTWVEDTQFELKLIPTSTTRQPEHVVNIHQVRCLMYEPVNGVLALATFENTPSFFLLRRKDATLDDLVVSLGGPVQFEKIAEQVLTDSLVAAMDSDTDTLASSASASASAAGGGKGDASREGEREEEGTPAAVLRATKYVEDAVRFRDAQWKGDKVVAHLKVIESYNEDQRRRKAEREAAAAAAGAYEAPSPPSPEMAFFSRVVNKLIEDSAAEGWFCVGALRDCPLSTEAADTSTPTSISTSTETSDSIPPSRALSWPFFAALPVFGMGVRFDVSMEEEEEGVEEAADGADDPLVRLQMKTPSWLPPSDVTGRVVLGSNGNLAIHVDGGYLLFRNVRLERLRRHANARRYAQEIMDLEAKDRVYTQRDNLAGYRSTRAAWEKALEKLDERLGTSFARSQQLLEVAPFLPIILVGLLISAQVADKTIIEKLLSPKELPLYRMFDDSLHL